MKQRLDAMHPELRWCIEDVARQVRRRRWFAAARRFGWILFGLTGAFTVLLAAVGGDGVKGAVFLGVYAAGVLAGAIVSAIPALRSPVRLEQVALYIDEHHPELENRMASALDLTSQERAGVSSWLTQKFVEDALERVRATSFADVLDPKPAQNLGISAAAMVISSVILFYLFGYLWLPTLSFVLPTPVVKTTALPFTVEPGDVRVRTGDNQMIWVRTNDADREVRIRWRSGGGTWQEAKASQSSTERVYYHQFTSIQQDIQYQVAYGPRRSPDYRITTWTPPEVTSIDLTYTYPDYLRKPPREVPNSGNITAIEGTEVDVDVWTNKPVAKADMVLESGERLPLAKKADTRWTVPITLEKDDAYHIELVDFDDAGSEYPQQYTIAVHRDKPPEIEIDFPRGDNQVTSLDEVPFDFEVSDDYGFDSYGVQYEIAGRDPVKIPMNEDDDLITTAEGHHTLLLEDLGLEPGDFITWTVWAKDTKPDRSEYEVMGDPYFLEVRPFKREYREALTGGGMPGGMGGQQGQQRPEQAQKDILIATWNLRRDARYMDDKEFTEKRGVIVDTQQNLMQQISAEGGVMRAPDPNVLKLREAMQGSIEALTRASLPDPKPDLSEATTHQQNAMRLLARMKPDQAQVQQMQGGGGGGGGGAMEQGPDISALEMARNRNFYEQQSMTREQQKVNDEILKRIKELAQRQQNINEELAKLISELQHAKTEEEQERIRRELERLRDEMKSNLERVDQARQQLNNNALNNEQTQQAQDALERARHQMNRSLEQFDRNELQQARSAGSRAMDALDDIEEHLQQFGRGAAAQRMRDLQNRMRDLQARQKDIVQKAEDARKLHESPSFSDQKQLEETQDKLKQEKDKLSDDFVKMMDEASELAQRSQQTQELMSRKLGDWMRQTSKDGIYEDIEETKPLVEYGIWDSALREERKIAQKFDNAAEKLNDVANSLVEDDLEGMQQALEHLDRLLNREEVARALQQQDDQNGAQAPSDNGDQEKMGPGGRPDQEQEDQSGAGGKTSEQEGQEKMAQSGQKPEDDSEREGLGRVTEENQPSDEQQRMQVAQQDRQPGPGQGSQQEPSERAQSQSGSQDGRNQQGQSRPNGQPQSGRPGATDGAFNRDRAMRDFAQNGYQDWLEELRNAEALLPKGTPIRTQVTRLRERVERMREDWRARALAPQFDLFLEFAARPLADTAEDLQREIQKRLGEQEFLLTDEGDIPERYRDQVAEYFKRLSEAEAAR